MKKIFLEYFFFLNAPARHLKRGVEIDVNMMLTEIYYHPQRLGMKCLQNL